MTARADLLAIASENHGLLARHHLGSDAAGRQRWRRVTRSELWVHVTDRVVRSLAAPRTLDQHVAAAVLDVGPGAALYGVSAAAQWGLRGFVHSTRHRVHVVRPERSPRLDSDLAVVHTTARAVDRDIRVLRSVSTTSPVQTILDLARTLDRTRLEAAIDRALHKRLLTTTQLHDALSTIARSGRDGVVSLRAALEFRPPGYVPTESNLESRVAWLTRQAGLGEFRRQVAVGGPDEAIGRVDFLHRRLPLILEVNSEEFHAALVDELADAARYERLQNVGFTVVVIDDTDVWYDPGGVVERIRAALDTIALPAA